MIHAQGTIRPDLYHVGIVRRNKEKRREPSIRKGKGGKTLQEWRNGCKKEMRLTKADGIVSQTMKKEEEKIIKTYRNRKKLEKVDWKEQGRRRRHGN